MLEITKLDADGNAPKYVELRLTGEQLDAVVWAIKRGIKDVPVDHIAVQYCNAIIEGIQF